MPRISMDEIMAYTAERDEIEFRFIEYPRVACMMDVTCSATTDGAFLPISLENQLSQPSPLGGLEIEMVHAPTEELVDLVLVMLVVVVSFDD